MKLKLLFLLFLLPILSTGQSGMFEVMDYEEFKSIYLTESEQPVVFNFWATWCKPCVKEMPHFLKMAETETDLKLILVSLDFPQHFESRLRPFLVENDIMETVVVLDESNANVFIDDIDPSWQGSIPATLVWDGEKIGFAEAEFHTYEELMTFINQSLNSKK